MKKILIIALTMVVLSAMPSYAYYIIDGKVDDWGIDLNAAVNKGYLDANLPFGGNDIDYWTEDNADMNSGVNTYVGPGYTHEGNIYDAEAIYFDNDATHAYIAIITGLPSTNPGNLKYGWYPAGDLFINVGSESDPFDSTSVPSVGSTYAINVLNGDLYTLSSADVLKDVTYNTPPNDHSAASPWRLDYSKATPTDNLGADLVYTAAAINGHYVIETKIAFSDIGLADVNQDKIWLHWTMECGNDVLKLNADVNAVPEPATLFLFSSSLLGLLGFKRKIFA